MSLAVENMHAQPAGKLILTSVLKAGGDADTRMSDNNPVIMVLVNQRDCDGIRLLKSLGANLDILDRARDPIITKAAIGMDWDVVWCLMELGARFDYERGGARLPLSKALANKAPSRSSPIFTYKEKVWRRLKETGAVLAPLPN